MFDNVTHVCDWVAGDDTTEQHVILEDGRISYHITWCDWREEQFEAIMKLVYNPLFDKTTHEIVQCADGTDSYTFAIVERKV